MDKKQERKVELPCQRAFVFVIQSHLDQNVLYSLLNCIAMKILVNAKDYSFYFDGKTIITCLDVILNSVCHS